MKTLDYLRSRIPQGIKRRNEFVFERTFIHKRRLTTMLPVKFMVTPPYGLAVFLVVGMPYLGTEERTTLGAYDARSKNSVSAILAPNALYKILLTSPRLGSMCSFYNPPSPIFLA